MNYFIVNNKLKARFYIIKQEKVLYRIMYSTFLLFYNVFNLV